MKAERRATGVAQADIAWRTKHALYLRAGCPDCNTTLHAQSGRQPAIARQVGHDIGFEVDEGTPEIRIGTRGLIGRNVAPEFTKRLPETLPDVRFELSRLDPTKRRFRKAASVLNLLTQQEGEQRFANRIARCDQPCR